MHACLCKRLYNSHFCPVFRSAFLGSSRSGVVRDAEVRIGGGAIAIGLSLNKDGVDLLVRLYCRWTVALQESISIVDNMATVL